MQIIANDKTLAAVHTHTHTGNLINKYIAWVESKLEKENKKKLNKKHKIRLDLS